MSTPGGTSRVTQLVGLVGDGARLVEDTGTPTVVVDPGCWRRAVEAAVHQQGCDFFDWLTAVDREDAGFDVLARLWSVPGREGVLLSTRVPRTDARVDSLAPVIAGAAWHEREVHEMFGIDFPGHPALNPLLLPADFGGRPLRKDFVLAARVAKPWPGVVDPSGASAGGRPRRRMRPPGVGEGWGSAAGIGR